MAKNVKIKKSGQEEMVGFALIIIVVAVILLIFLGIWLREDKTDSVESYELNSFMQVLLEYTVDCLENYETDACVKCSKRYYSLKELIIACNEGEKCIEEVDTCDVLEPKLKSIIDSIWKVSENTPLKGYNLKIDTKEESILEIKKGNTTNNYKTSVQRLGRDNLQVEFNIYY